MGSKYLYLSVKEKLLEQIQEMQPSERIPSRNDLMKRHNVTRTTIDRAISELVGEGILYAIDGSGTYVAERVKANPMIHDTPGVPNSSIGVVIPNILSHDYPEIVRGIEDMADSEGFNIIVCSTDNQVEKQRHYIRKLVNSCVRGVIIVPVTDDVEIESFRHLEAAGIPFVFCNRAIDGIHAPAVVSNNFHGAFLAVKHLIQSGCSKIGFLSRPVYSVIRERQHGYMAALDQYGLPFEEALVSCEDYSQYQDKDGSACRRMLQLLQANPGLDAVLCTNDRIAMNAVKAIRDSGKKVPSDIRVIGFDNSQLCEMSPVKLTSVSFDKYGIGSKACSLLLELLQGTKTVSGKVFTFPPNLVLRESTGKQGEQSAIAHCSSLGGTTSPFDGAMAPEHPL